MKVQVLTTHWGPTVMSQTSCEGARTHWDHTEHRSQCKRVFVRQIHSKVVVKGGSWETEVERRQHDPPVGFPCFEKLAEVQRTADAFLFIVVVDAAQDVTLSSCVNSAAIGQVWSSMWALETFVVKQCPTEIQSQKKLMAGVNESLITTNNGPEPVSPLMSSWFDQCGRSDVMTYLKEGTEEPARSRLRLGVSTAGDQL